LLETLLSEARCPIEVRVDTTRLRQGVIPRVAGDAGRLKRELGWIPSIPFRTTLAGILEERRAAALA
jgi:hypothetical protein